MSQDLTIAMDAARDRARQTFANERFVIVEKGKVATIGTHHTIDLIAPTAHLSTTLGESLGTKMGPLPIPATLNDLLGAFREFRVPSLFAVRTESFVDPANDAAAMKEAARASATQFLRMTRAMVASIEKSMFAFSANDTEIHILAAQSGAEIITSAVLGDEGQRVINAESGVSYVCSSNGRINLIGGMEVYLSGPVNWTGSFECGVKGVGGMPAGSVEEQILNEQRTTVERGNNRLISIGPGMEHRLMLVPDNGALIRSVHGVLEVHHMGQRVATLKPDGGSLLCHQSVPFVDLVATTVSAQALGLPFAMKAM